MKKNRKMSTIILCLMVLLMLSMMVGTSAEKKVYINGIDPDYPPFAYVDEKGNPAGFDVESLDWIAKEMGFEVKHQPTAWDGIISALLAKKIDMVYSGMSITLERLEKVDFSNPYWEIDQALCVRNDSDLNIIAALSGKYVVGTQRACTAAMWIEDHLVNTGIIPKENLKLYDSFSLAVQDLVNGRVDSAMMDDVMVEDAIRKGQPVKIVGIIKTGEAFGVAVRKEDKELKEMLNEGIKRLLKADIWEELKAKYLTD
jgi:polar amino acid transport system substrate-binding protein